MKKYWELFWLFRKYRFMEMVEYRSDFLFWSIVSVMWTVFNFVFFTLIVNISGSIAGWDKAQLYVLLSVFTMLDAFTWSFMAKNMYEYTDDIFSGRLSLWLTKPVETQFLVMTQNNSYSNAPRLLIGMVMLVISIYYSHINLTLLDIIFGIITLSTGIMFMYLLWFSVATVTFYVGRLKNINEIVPAMRRIFQVPRNVFSGISSTALTVFLPLALVTSVPGEFFTGQGNILVAGYFMLWTLCLFLFSRWFFNFSLKKYASTGG